MSQQLFNVKLKSKGKNYECSKVDSILESGLRSGLALRYECNNGTCGSCKARLLTGNIKQIKHYDFSLSKAELANAEFLMCCHAPTTDIEIELDLIGDVRSIPLQKIETKVREISFISDNMALMRLRAPRSKALQFMAGQDVELAFNSNRARYPLASCPCQMLDLEFHIRNNPADDFAQALFSKALKVKSKVILQGPKGIFVLKQNSKRPMLFIAWDGGFAPIRSLVEHTFSLEMSNPLDFYWAYPAEESAPYLDNQAKSWQAVVDKYSYTPLACEFDLADKNACRRVSQQIFAALNLEKVKASDVYIAAPAEVLIDLSELLLANGLPESQLIASPI